MNNSIKKAICCPICKGNLRHDENDHIKCIDCNALFEIRNGIYDFNVHSRKSFYDVSGKLERVFSNSDIVNKLLEANNDSLNISDLYAKYFYYLSKGCKEEALNTIKHSCYNSYTKECRNAIYSCFEKIKSILEGNKDNSLIMDFASGNGNLTRYIIDDIISENYIVNDIDYNNLETNRELNVQVNPDKDIKYFCFDLKKIPLKDDSIDFAISFVGFQNITDINELLYELKRVIRKKIYHISMFCDPNDKINLMALRRRNLVEQWVRERFVGLVQDNGFEYKNVYSVAAECDPLPMGKIVEGYRIDSFPIKRTTVLFEVGEMTKI